MWREPPKPSQNRSRCKLRHAETPCQEERRFLITQQTRGCPLMRKGSRPPRRSLPAGTRKHRPYQTPRTHLAMATLGRRETTLFCRVLASQIIIPPYLESDEMESFRQENGNSGNYPGGPSAPTRPAWVNGRKAHIPGDPRQSPLMAVFERSNSHRCSGRSHLPQRSIPCRLLNVIDDNDFRVLY